MKEKIEFQTRSRKWKVTVTIEAFETEAGRTGTMVILDSESGRLVGVSLQHPDEEGDFRTGVKVALFRANPIFGPVIWKALREKWYRDLQTELAQLVSANYVGLLEMIRLSSVK